MAEIFIITDMGGLQHFQMWVIFARAIPFYDFMSDSIDKGVEVLNLHGGNPIHINLNVRKKLDKVLMGGKFAEQAVVNPTAFQKCNHSVVIPIAGIIITLILCYELISMLTERNNLHDVDTWMFFKYFVKMWIAVYLVSHTFDIAMAVFDIGQSVVNSSSGIIRGNTAIDISSLSMQMQAAMATMAIGELVTLALETLVVSWCLKILSVVITVIMYGRMIEIYLYTSLAPIPFATMSNREWGHVGTNYFRGLFALAFQAFLMMVCVAIYAALIGSIRVSSDIHSALFGTMAYTVILCFSLLKTGSLSKQIFGSH